MWNTPLLVEYMHIRFHGFEGRWDTFLGCKSSPLSGERLPTLIAIVSEQHVSPYAITYGLTCFTEDSH
jgi:hypothetical protein